MKIDHKKLTRMQNFSVISRLMVVCKKADGGMAIYEEGHNDNTVALEFDISSGQVAACRTDAIGMLSANNRTKASTRLRLDDLENRLTALEAKVTSWDVEE